MDKQLAHPNTLHNALPAKDSSWLFITLLTVLATTVICLLLISDNQLFILPAALNVSIYISAPVILALHFFLLKSSYQTKQSRLMNINILVLATLMLIIWRFSALQDIFLTGLHTLILFIDIGLLIYYQTKIGLNRLYVSAITLITLIFTVRVYGVYQVLYQPNAVNLLLDSWLIPSLKVDGLNQDSAQNDNPIACDANKTHQQIKVTKRNFNLLSIQNSTLCNIDFSKSKLIGAVISHSNILGDFNLANLSVAQIKHTTFLPNSRFIGTNFKRATFKQSIANEVDFSLAQMYQTNIESSHIIASQLLQTSLISAYVNNSDLSQSSFFKANLRNIKFNKTKLINNDFRAADGLNGYYFTSQETLHPNAEPNIVKNCLLGSSRFYALSNQEKILAASGCTIEPNQAKTNFDTKSSQQIAAKLVQAYFIAPRKTLDLSHLNLTQLPESAHNLKGVSVLKLDHNPISQQGLEQIILNFADLKHLSLKAAGLEKLPDSIANLKHLELLNVERNQLTELPESIGQLKQLKRLYLDHNQIEEIPKSIGKLKNLELLNVTNNYLTKLPANFDQLNNLHWVNLNHNQITQLPDDFGQLSQLYILEIGYNPLSSLPSSIKDLKALVNLCIDNTDINEFPTIFEQRVANNCRYNL